jgi:polysaccharide pyruvyl transferase WcaK-like protein
LRGKIGVWGHFHGGNIGDDIVVATMIAHLRQRVPGHEIYGFSLNPADTAARHRVPSAAIQGGPFHRVGSAPSNPPDQTDAGPRPSTPAKKAAEPVQPSGVLAAVLRVIRMVLPARVNPALRASRRLLRDLLRMPSLWRRLRQFDAIFVAGSGPVFDDMGGPWVHPYNLLRWAITCRLAGTKFCLMNVGAGPIHQPLSGRFLSWALGTSHYLSFRDESSVELVRTLGVRQPCSRHCDMAFAIPEAELEIAHACASQEVPCPLIGIAPMAYMDKQYWPDADTSIGERYLDALAELSIWLLSAGYNLVLLKSQRHADERTASALLAKMKKLSPSLDETRIHNPETRGHQDLLRYMAGCTIVVGGRFHCHVLPFVLGIPVLGVSYHPKTDELMRQMEQDEYFVSMDKVTGKELIDLFQRLRENRLIAAAEIQRHSADNRKTLCRQFDEIFSVEFLDG